MHNSTSSDLEEVLLSQLKALGHKVDLQILDNEASAAYKQVIEEGWKAQFQLVPPNIHLRNAAKWEIRTFKDHFLAILVGAAQDFPPYLWDFILKQMELTLNILHQATLNPRLSAWDYFNGAFN